MRFNARFIATISFPMFAMQPTIANDGGSTVLLGPPPLVPGGVLGILCYLYPQGRSSQHRGKSLFETACLIVAKDRPFRRTIDLGGLDRAALRRLVVTGKERTDHGHR